MMEKKWGGRPTGCERPTVQEQFANLMIKKNGKEG